MSGRQGKAELAGAGVPAKWGRTTARRWVRWNKTMKALFLDHLAATCHVKAAAAAAGVRIEAVYALRRRDEAFRDAWHEALAQGYEMLETLLVGHAIAGGGPTIDTGTDAIGPIDRDLALQLLTKHRCGLTGKPLRGGPRLRDGSREDTDAAILKKLDALATARARAAAAAGDAVAGDTVAITADAISRPSATGPDSQVAA